MAAGPPAGIKIMLPQQTLITGAGGFIGSHLAERCVELGYKVKAFLRYNSRNNWGWLEYSKYKKDIEVISGDIREFDSVYHAIKGCDTIFHLAALIGIPYSYVCPGAYIKTNVEGTYNVLQAAKMLNVDNVLVTSTSETYGTAQYVPMDEKHPTVAQSPYAATKIAADELGLSYYRSFKLPVKIIRPFNTYGPRQSGRAIIPTIITQILSGCREIKTGSLSPKRDFTLVDDTVSGFINIAESTSLSGQVTNIGMNEEISVGDLAHLISKILHINVEVTTEDIRVRPDESEVERLMCDNSKLMRQTEWKPRYNLKVGLEKTIEWFKENLDFYKRDIYNI